MPDESLAKSFYDIVIPQTPVDRTIDDVRVGEAVYIEGQKDGKVVERMIRIVTCKRIIKGGQCQIEFRKPGRGEYYDAPTLTILTQNPSTEAKYES